MPRRSLVDMGFVKSQLNLAVIAKKLGISASTVSRALRNAPSIHPMTRQRVIDMAQSMGYLKQEEHGVEKKVRNILMLSQAGNASVDGAYLAGLSQAAVSLNLSLISHHFKPEECENILNPVFQPRALKDGVIDGIVLLHRWPEQVVKKLNAKIPLVSIIHSYPGVPIDLIGIEEREGMLDLVHHLAAAGHTQIGFFGFCRSMSWARSRFGVYVEALAEKQLPYLEKNVVSVSLEEALAEELLDSFEAAEIALRRSAEGVTAWISSSENLGYSLCKAALKKGIKIPKNLAITGFHSSNRFGAHGLPVLTSVSSSAEELGAAALRRLVTRLESPNESRRSILLPCAFFQGETTKVV